MQMKLKGRSDLACRRRSSRSNRNNICQSQRNEASLNQKKKKKKKKRKVIRVAPVVLRVGGRVVKATFCRLRRSEPCRDERGTRGSERDKRMVSATWCYLRQCDGEQGTHLRGLSDFTRA